MFLLPLLLAAPIEDVGGWPALFPQLGNFSFKLSAPVVNKDEKPTVYSQTARYGWLGGRYEEITITLTRNPKVKDVFSTDGLKLIVPAPETLEVNKKSAYSWKSTEGGDFQKMSRRLVVVLADDKALILEQYGRGLDLAEVAKKLDFEKVVKELDSPPPAAPKKE
jgi:hypothetical protein